VFLRPSGLAGRVVGRGTGVVFSVLKRVTGVDLLADLSTFFRALGGLIDGFRERAQQVNALLGDPQTTFLLVTSPEREPIDEAIYFRRKLKAARMPFGGVVVNRVHHDEAPEGDPAEVAAELEDELGARLAAKVAENLRDYRVLAERDRANIEHLAEKLDLRRMLLVPYLDEDVHDIAGLARVHRFLFATEAERARLLSETVA
jgi:anion-transporting  ArsA/GET3 family ATPase